MIGSILESLLLGLVVLAGFTFLVVVTGGFLLWRYGRRKLRAFRSHGAVIGATAMWDVAASNRWNRSGVAVTSAELQQWTSARVAKEMWRTVDRASAAVRATDELGGPTAELPSLCRRLQAAAVDIDKVLRVDSGARVPAALGDQVLEVMRAATDVQQAAVASAGETSAQRIRDLTEDAGHELSLLDAGLDSMRTSGRPELPH
ncbi:MAG TPA: hypothetical protein VIH95_04785 [Acidimicrobiales bacterium]